MDKLLVVVDMQNDFIDGALGTPEAVAIVPKVIEKMSGWDGDIICTRDTHEENYLQTREGKYLPIPHCIQGTDGHKLNRDVLHYGIRDRHHGDDMLINKRTFGSEVLPELVRYERYKYIELVGLVTNICLISNALLLKTMFPETDIAVDASCCAGTSSDLHQKALDVMRSCQIDIINEE